MQHWRARCAVSGGGSGRGDRWELRRHLSDDGPGYGMQDEPSGLWSNLWVTGTVSVSNPS
jgi:hypothetical protein